PREPSDHQLPAVDPVIPDASLRPIDSCVLTALMPVLATGFFCLLLVPFAAPPRIEYGCDSAQPPDHLRRHRQHVLPQLLRTRAVPAGAWLRVVVVILERHLDGERQTIEGLANGVARPSQVGLARFIARITEAGLKFRTDPHQTVAEVLLQLGQTRCITRVALTAGSEHMRNFLIAMDIEKQVDTDALHMLQHEQHFRAAL